MAGMAARRDKRHARRTHPRRLSWLPELLVVALLAAAGANAQYDLGRRWFGTDQGTVRSDPAAVRPPEGLDLVAGSVAGPVGTSSPGGRLDRAAVAAALAPYARDPRLGGHVSIEVRELGTGAVAYRRGAASVVPASTMKLLTTTAALQTLGPMARFTTRVVATGNRVVLVGGGDPFLASRPIAGPRVYPVHADLRTLAQRTAAALKARSIRQVTLGYDASLFTGPAVNPHWPDSYVPENVVPPISALWVNEGQEPTGRYTDDPAAAAGTAFATALRREGIAVRGAARERKAPSQAVELAAVQSSPLGEIVQQTLAVSDNNAAEVIARHVGAAVAHDASSLGASAAVLKVLRGLGVDVTGSRVYDGSGLSRDNRLTPAVLTGVLRVAASKEHPRLREVITGLPVAGFTGSLQHRFDAGPAAARGRVRAKTGTLTGVHGLAGIATDVQGNLMAFVLIADRVAVPNTLAARRDLDLMAAALGACRCGVQE